MLVNGTGEWMGWSRLDACKSLEVQASSQMNFLILSSTQACLELPK